VGWLFAVVSARPDRREAHSRRGFLVGLFRARIDRLASTAASLGVRLMIDAEQTYFQPAIDNIITDLQVGGR
jgi:hypothetical protein